MNRIILIFSFLIAGNALSANGNDLIQALQECKQLASSDNRLACFDSIKVPTATVEKVVAVEANKPLKDVVKKVEVTPISTAEVAPTRVIKKEEFGLKNIIKEPEYITLTVERTKKNPYGDITVYMQEGQVWKQTDGRALRLKLNDKVFVKKGALNSFQMQKEGGSRLMKVKRIK